MGALLGIGALLALAVAFSVSSDQEAPINVARPRRSKKKGVSGALATFHYVTVPWIHKGIDDERILVRETPSELKAQAEAKLGRKITGSAFALATMIASEHGSDVPLVKAAIASTALNYALKNGWDVEEAITRGLGPARSFGDERGHRYASTRLPPTEEDLLIAEAVLDGTMPDVTRGALHFDSPMGQRNAIKKKLAGYGPENTPEAVAERRMKKGLVPFYLDGVNPERVRFWKPKAT